MAHIIGEKEFFKNIGEIKYEGRESDNPLAFNVALLKLYMESLGTK